MYFEQSDESENIRIIHHIIQYISNSKEEILKKKKNRSSGFMAGFVSAAFVLLFAVGMIYGLKGFNVSMISSQAIAGDRTVTQQIGVRKIHQVADGEMKDIVLKPEGNAFCNLNIDGTPDQYRAEFEYLFSKVEEKKLIAITGWEYQCASPANVKIMKTERIYGVLIQYTPK